MASFMLKLIGVLIVVGAIFFAGVAVGSGSGSGISTDDVLPMQQCLPIETVTDLHNCAVQVSQ